MKILSHRYKVPIGAIISACVLFVGLAIFLLTGNVFAASDTETGGRLVTIHDRGVDKTVLTQANTVAGALDAAGISVDSNDAVEPAVGSKLVAKQYDINIYRARPVVVVDGATRQKVITPYQTAAQIAGSAGIKLYDEDSAVISRTDDIVAEGAGLKLTITRAVPFQMDFYGKTSTVRTLSKTVGEMLSSKGISLGDKDKVSPSLSTTISNGMSVRIWREGKQTVTVQEPVDFNVRQIQDADQPIGYKAIKTPGVKGEKTVTYEVVIINGQESTRTQIASIEVKPASTQVEIIGAKYRGAYTTPSQNETITWNFLTSNGFSREQAAGIMGNLMQEHGFNTTGDGLVQWTGSRKAALLSRPDPYSIDTQLDFLMYELNGSYSSVKSALLGASTVNQAVLIFQNQFERCGVCMEGSRVQFAYNILASH